MGDSGQKNDDGKLGHRPFAGLKALKGKLPAKKAPARPELARVRLGKHERPDEDAQLFAQAMHDVQRFKEETPVPKKVLEPEAKLPEPDAEDEEVRQVLTALVRGEQKFARQRAPERRVPFDLDISDTDEFIEGAVEGFDRRTRDRLKRGEFSVQAHLDLHGLNREEAHAALDGFVRDQRQRGRRCVLVIHGRGLNSAGQVPVLKEQMGRWLSRGLLGRAVLAFCTARPTDGGAGALYVLLRR